MSDLTSDTAKNIIAGGSAITVQLLGIPAGALIYGFIGAGWGVTMNPKPSRWHLFWSFLFSMFGGAGCGTLASELLVKHPAVVSVTSLVASYAFIKLAAVAADALPAVLTQWIDKARPKQ